MEAEKHRDHFRLSVPDCNKYSLAQTWEKIQNTVLRFQICKKDSGKCLTVSNGFFNSNRAVSLTNYVKGSENQLWTIHEEKDLLENVDSRLCLFNVAIVAPLFSGIEARVCSENSVDKMRGTWSFVPLNNCVY